MATVDTAVETTVETPVDPDTRLSARIIRFLKRTPVHIVPRADRDLLAGPDHRALHHLAADAVRRGAGRLVDLRHEAEHLDARELRQHVRQRGDHARALGHGARHDRRDDRADPRCRAGRLRARLDRVPRPRLALPADRRAPARADPDGADPDLPALQHPQPLRHDPRADPLPLRVRAAVRDLPAAQLLRRHPPGPDGGCADRRRVRVGPLLQGRAPARDPGDRLARDLPGALRLERPARRARARAVEPADRAGDRRRSCASSAPTSTCSRPPPSSRRSSR